MLKKWVTSIRTGLDIAKILGKPVTQIHLTETDVMCIDSGFTCIIETPETTIILTSEKSAIDTPKE